MQAEKEAKTASLYSKGRIIPESHNALGVMFAFVTEANKDKKEEAIASFDFGDEVVVMRAENGILSLVSRVPKG